MAASHFVKGRIVVYYVRTVELLYAHTFGLFAGEIH